MSENKYVKRFLNPASIWAIIWALFQIWIVFRGSFSALVPVSYTHLPSC